MTQVGIETRDFKVFEISNYFERNIFNAVQNRYAIRTMTQKTIAMWSIFTITLNKKGFKARWSLEDYVSGPLLEGWRAVWYVYHIQICWKGTQLSGLPIRCKAGLRLYKLM
jgi:hypothetical protein